MLKELTYRLGVSFLILIGSLGCMVFFYGLSIVLGASLTLTIGCFCLLWFIVAINVDY